MLWNPQEGTAVALRRARMAAGAQAHTGASRSIPGEHGEDRLLRVGRNAWRTEHAERVAFLIDAQAYYRALASALHQARHSILIAAWEIDDRVVLDPDEPGALGLGRLLLARLDACPTLQVHVLAWDFAMMYALERGLQPLLRLRFGHQRRLHMELDGHHPVGASHHQKMVVVDDRVAFLGGLDLTERRWDSPAHAADDPLRVDHRGRPYPPFHDVQVLVQGNAAAAVGVLFRERWRLETGKRPPPPPSIESAPWPETLPPDVRNVEVALARTQPAHEDQEEAREVESLYLDSIAAARQSLYVENQYLTSASIVAGLRARLEAADGPEIVLVLPRRCPGWLEQHTVGLLRRRVLHELRVADRHGRLRALYPDVPGAPDGVFVHAKLMIVDDRIARIGSANLNNRSMGFDTELDLAIVAEGRDDVAEAIASLRARLLAEHLGVSPEEVRGRLSRSGGSLIRTIDALASRDGRTLRVIDDDPLEPGWDDALELGEVLTDPESPERPERLIESFLARDIPGATRTPWVRAAIVAGFLVLIVHWAAGGDVLDALRTAGRHGLMPLGLLVAYVGATLAFVPVTVLLVLTVVLLDPLPALATAYGGIACGAMATFAAGRLLGRGRVRRLAGRRASSVSRHLTRNGARGVAKVRLLPIASFTIVNLVAGASRTRWRDYLPGTLLGVSPGVIGIVLVSAALHAFASDPAPTTIVLLGVVSAGLLGLFALLRRMGVRSDS